MTSYKCIFGILTAALILSAAVSCSDKEPDSPQNPDAKPPLQFNRPARNPWLAQETYSITHFDSAQTDAFPFRVADGVYRVDIEQCPSTWSGPVNLMTLASTSMEYMWGMSSDRVSYTRVADGAF